MNVFLVIFLTIAAFALGCLVAYALTRGGIDFGPVGMRRLVIGGGVTFSVILYVLVLTEIFSPARNGSFWLLVPATSFTVGLVFLSRRLLGSVPKEIGRLFYYAPMIQELLESEFDFISNGDGVIGEFDLLNAIEYYSDMGQIDKALYLECLARHLRDVGFPDPIEDAWTVSDFDNPMPNHAALSFVLRRNNIGSFVDRVRERFRGWESVQWRVPAAI